MLTIQDLTFAYQAQSPVLSELSLTLGRGQIHGLVGTNGAGKTTLFQAISGFLPYQQGDIRWCGQPLSLESVVLLEAQQYFYPYLTGLEYLQIFQHYYPKMEIEVFNTIFQLPLKQLISTYSTGMKKKLSLMAVISMQKPLLVLDEPFNGIDLEGSFSIQKILQMLKAKGTTILVSSHIFESLITLCDHIHYLENGKIRQSYKQQAFAQLRTDIATFVDKQHEQAWLNIENLL